MGIVEWFKKTTFEGKIKESLASIDAAKGSGRLEVQLMEEELNGQALYRVNLVRTTIGSYQSLPILITEN